MKLSEIKNHLKNLTEIAFKLPNGDLVPEHFHVSEIGHINKTFIDCGGTVRTDNVINFQLWNANDYNHRLHPEKLVSIIELSEQTLGLNDYEIEVEYQGESINKYGLEFDGNHFVLTNTHTGCLAPSQCETPKDKPRVKLSELQNTSCCAPSSGCC